MIVDLPSLISRIALERPASIRRHLPVASDLGWLLPEYFVGPENHILRFLFDPSTIERLEQLSPIVLYGDKEVGKTALSITLAVSWARVTSLRPLCFTTGQQFATDYAAAVEIDDVDSFRLRHRTCKLLFIDDLEGLASAPASQTELVSTLDLMEQARQPVIVTVQRLPSSVTGLCAPLASRLAGGLSVPLSKPLVGTLHELLPALVHHVDPLLPIDQVTDLCLKFSCHNLSAVDMLKIVTLASQNKFSDGSLDSDIAYRLAEQLFSGTCPTVSDIAKVVARKMQVRLVELRGATRQANIVRARGLAIWLARKMTSSSLQKIGEFFGGRDHSTIIHACRKTEQLLDSDTELANVLLEVQAELLKV